MKAILFFATLLSLVQAFAMIEIKTTPGQGDVQFDAIGKPSMLKIKGKGEGAVAQLQIENSVLNGTLKFKMETLNTGIDLRDEHMKEKYLQVKQYPEATLTFKDFKLPESWTLKSPTVKELTFAATLTLHGVEKPVAGTFVIENQKLAGHANFEIKLSDFNIEIPNYLGVKVADVVKIVVTFTQMDAHEVAAAVAPKADATKTESKKEKVKKK